MKRHWVFALAALAVLPRMGQAQGDGWGPRLRVTPFVGVSPGFNQVGEAVVFANSSTTFHRYRLEESSSLAVGVNIDYRAWQRFGVIAGGLWSHRGDDRLIDFEDEVIYPTTGSSLFLVKLGPSLHLKEERSEMQLRRLDGLIYIAPTFIYDRPNKHLSLPALSATGINQWGVNIGAEGELPLADSRFAFTAALDDYMIFWDEMKYAQRIQIYFDQGIQNIQALAINTNKTHMFVGRIGLSFRF